MATKTSVAPAAQEREPDLPEIEVGDVIPQFASERAEADYWASHGFGKSFFDQDLGDDPDLPPPRPRTRPVSIRFDQDTIALFPLWYVAFLLSLTCHEAAHALAA